MLSSLCFVPKGAARERPIRYEVSAEEARKMKEMQAKLEESLAPKDGLDENGLPAELRMDAYGEDHDDVLWEEDGAEEDVEGSKLMESTMNDSDDAGEEDEVSNMEEDEEAEDQDEEEQVEDTEVAQDFDDDDDLGSDEEDFLVKPTDRMIAVAKTDEEFCNLEVYLYDTSEGNLYVHHDIALPAFPLCTAWVGCGKEVFGDSATTDSKNYIAVGTFKPEIELWNLDVLDALEPTVILNKDAEGEATMGLSWNKTHQSLLASGSADNIVRLWDLTKGECAQTFTHHKDKVQCVEWNPVESSILLTGSFDKTLAVFDAKVAGSPVVHMPLSADVESCAWNPHEPQQVVASTEDGMVTCFDVRNAGAGPLYSFQAHARKPCSSISFNAHVPGILATCSPDKSVKLWDLMSSSGPCCIGSKAMAAGALFAVSFDMDDPYLLATGGDKGMLALWEVNEDVNVERLFKSRMSGDLSASAPPQNTESAQSGEAVQMTDATQSTTPKTNSNKKKKNKKKGGK